ncbi:MAG: XdhC family protein [Desulfobacterales bacterium]|nr:XdhC family protein [Desulfobacterales bacterium]
MKTIRVEDAVGTVLAHDLSRIIPGRFKSVGFKKGHVVTAADISELLKIGKSHLYVLELSADELHEDEASLRIAPAVSGANLTWGSPCDGKSSIRSTCDGLLRVNVPGLGAINQIGDLILTTGGLSVDPDDVTRMGIRRAGAEIIAYGSPILPGAMFLYAHLDETQILGLPACVYYHPTTVFDLMLPRVLATVVATRGSTPRRAGARMLVSTDGVSQGTIGGRSSPTAGGCSGPTGWWRRHGRAHSIPILDRIEP